MFAGHGEERKPTKKVETGLTEVYENERPVFPSQASVQLYPELHIRFGILD